jgi:hypothetical protein
VTRFITTLIISVFLTASLNAQVGKKPAAMPDKPAEFIVPVAVEQKFSIENPDAQARWKKDGEFYKALFVNPVNNLGYIIVYDKTGTVVRREKELERQDYPASISEHQEKKFPGEGVSVWSSTDSTGNVTFYSQKNEATFRYDKNGRLLDGGSDSLGKTPGR